MEPDGIHEVIRFKSYQIQSNLMGSMKFYNSNLQNPMESDGFMKF